MARHLKTIRISNNNAPQNLHFLIHFVDGNAEDRKIYVFKNCVETYKAKAEDMGANDDETSGFNSESGVLTLNFDNVPSGNTIAAGTPFIVKWTGDNLANVTDPVFEGVTVVNSSAADRTVTSTDGYVSFVGSFDPVGIGEGGDDSKLYLGAGSTFPYPNNYWSATEVDGYTDRAWRIWLNESNVPDWHDWDGVGKTYECQVRPIIAF